MPARTSKSHSRAVNRANENEPDQFESMRHSLGYEIRYAYRAFAKALADELAPHAITTSQWSALRVVWQEEGLSQVELAQRMLVEKASLTAVLADMEHLGLIVRKRSVDDRRKLRIYLTSSGRSLRARVLPLGSRINQRATRGLTPTEVKQFRSCLARMLDNLQK